ncbi:efflux RND transporter periplasmic adaptor subunit [Nitrosomonas aestuarii]|uniref:efflux RND transporter periplasmic adaptor subunit n=1 Tax=Nitrosomonas aestuarii TaxID=52441 RepID=UPI000D30337A|nr:HlyD family efflux transporter periplasmic adaptor subunit [Nitrosomonas aestuarii]PTN10934.1 multidrug efflux pump subunit AcrA (membrane-fusion protein) [Nitrosomonas aestuarii]
MKPRHQIFIATLIFLVGGLTSLILIQFPPQSDKQEETIAPPIVKVLQTGFQSKRLHVHSQGQVAAHTEIELMTEVSGHVIDLSPAFVNGGFFRKGDVLVTIDPADYDLRVSQARAQVKEARHLLAREEAEAVQARDEWEHPGQGDPSPLNQRIPQLAEMRAKLAAAEAAFRHANRLRQRTQVRAPFDGRVRSRKTGIGQYVTGNTILGILYSSDRAEIRLPVNTRDLAFVDLPDATDSVNPGKMPRVILTADYQGLKQTWLGRVVRSEGTVDRETGMVMLVAEVYDPFKRARPLPEPDKTVRSKQVNAVELPIGLFVEALIQGRRFDRLIILPASALFNNNHVAVLDQDNRLRLRTVKIFKSERKQVIIQAGLNANEQVLISGLLQPVEGMQVTPVILNSTSKAENFKIP